MHLYDYDNRFFKGLVNGREILSFRGGGKKQTKRRFGKHGRELSRKLY
jgi:hypothetical protein